MRLKQLPLLLLSCLSFLFSANPSLGQAARVVQEVAELASRAPRKVPARAVSPNKIRQIAEQLQRARVGPTYSLSALSNDTFELIKFEPHLTEGPTISGPWPNLRSEIETIGQANATVVVFEDVLFERKELLIEVNQLANFVVVLSDGQHLGVGSLLTRRGNELFFEKGRLLLQADNSRALHAALAELGRQRNKSDVEIISLLTETDDKAIRLAAGERQSYVRSKGDAFVTLLERSKKPIVIVIGHIEGRQFVVRDAGNVGLKYISIDSLEKIALDKHLELILLGCDAAQASTSSGTAVSINTERIASRLRQALDSDSYEGLFTSLAGSDTPLLLRTSLIDQINVIVTREGKHGSSALETSGHMSIIVGGSAFLLSLTAQEQNAQRKTALFRKLVSTLILLCYGVLLTCYRSPAWRDFLGVSPILPSFHRSMANKRLHVTRLVLFVFYLNGYTGRRIALYSLIVLVVSNLIFGIIVAKLILGSMGKSFSTPNNVSTVVSELKSFDARVWEWIKRHLVVVLNERILNGPGCKS